MKGQLTIKKGVFFDERFKILVQKLIGAQTSGENAYAINKLNSEIKKNGKIAEEEIKTKLREKFGQKNEDGTFRLNKTPEGQEIPNTWLPIEGQEEALDQAAMDFYDEDVPLKCRPLNPRILADVKISAFEIELLGDLYMGEGPGVPGLNLI